MGLLDFIMDEKRRGDASDIAAKVKSGEMQPQEAALALAQSTGDPTALATGLQQSALAKLNSGNPQVNGILPFMSPEQGISTLTNPMLMSAPTNGSALAKINGMAAPGDAPAKPSAIATLNAQTNAPGLNTDYLNTSVPSFYRNQVLDVIQGGELAKDITPRDRTLIMNWAHNVDPSFSETKGTLRNKMAGDMASNSASSQGGQAQQINSVTGHLYDLHETAHGLDNGPSQNLNWLGQALTPAGSDTGSQISNYNTILTRASPELNKFYVGGEGDSEGRASAKEAFSPLLPEGVIKNNVRTQIGLLKSKTAALQAARDRIMGGASTPVVNPMSEALIADMEGQPLTPEQQAMVNQHRTESNLPPKTWADQNPAEQKPDQPKISKEAAIAELRRRGKVK
jgi:hypothetical protein